MLNWFIQQLHIWVPAPTATQKVLMGTVGQRNMTRHVSSYVAEHCWKAEKVALYFLEIQSCFAPFISPPTSITTCCSMPGMMGMDSGCGGAPQFQPMGQAMGQAMAQPGQPMGQAMAPMGMEGYGLPAVAPMGQLPQMAQMQAATTLPQVGVTMPATVTHVPGRCWFPGILQYRYCTQYSYIDVAGGLGLWGNPQEMVYKQQETCYQPDPCLGKSSHFWGYWKWMQHWMHSKFIES